MVVNSPAPSLGAVEKVMLEVRGISMIALLLKLIACWLVSSSASSHLPDAVHTWA